MEGHALDGGIVDAPVQKVVVVEDYVTCFERDNLLTREWILERVG